VGYYDIDESLSPDKVGFTSLTICGNYRRNAFIYAFDGLDNYGGTEFNLFGFVLLGFFRPAYPEASFSSFFLIP